MNKDITNRILFASGLLLTAALVVIGLYTARDVPAPPPPQETATSAQDMQQKAEQTAEDSSPPPAPREELLQCRFYEETSFIKHQAAATQAAQEMQQSAGVRAAVIPHHLTAGAYITAFLSALEPEDYETVVLIAPNHSGKGGNFIYSLAAWDTPFGKLACDEALTETLMYDGIIKGKRSDEHMQEDHAISALIPYLASVMPQAKTVSVLIAGNTPTKQLDRLAALLADAAQDTRLLLLCSVDFSHYLQTRTALQMDETSIKAIEEGDSSRIASFDNDYCDSPPCLLTFLGFSDRLDCRRSLVWHGCSSALIGYTEDVYVEGGITTYQIWQACEE